MVNEFFLVETAFFVFRNNFQFSFFEKNNPKHNIFLLKIRMIAAVYKRENTKKNNYRLYYMKAIYTCVL